MKRATFINFTDKPFTVHWDGRATEVPAGEKLEGLNENVARVFAKHLANKVLLEQDQERSMSPKKPEQDAKFMKVFNKAFIEEGSGREFDAVTGLPIKEGQHKKSPDQISMEQPSMNIHTVEQKKQANADPYDANAQEPVGPGGKPQVVGEIVADEDTFEGKEK